MSHYVFLRFQDNELESMSGFGNLNVIYGDMILANEKASLLNVTGFGVREIGGSLSLYVCLNKHAAVFIINKY
jgi:hypothetical protein